MSAQTHIKSPKSPARSPKSLPGAPGNARERPLPSSSGSADAVTGGHTKPGASEAGAVRREGFHKRRQSDEVGFPLPRVDSHFTASDHEHPHSNFTPARSEDCTGLVISGDEPFHFSCPNLECPRKFENINDVYKHEPESVDKPLCFLIVVEYFFFCRCSHAFGQYGQSLSEFSRSSLEKRD